ncbi:MAG: S-methyl-5-thioribose-1-phosphate isomerase [Elusimicrobiota bacterium]|nr:S-methyl-5-thioribose-1-phosphate isomerase [Endomicrobiia bacterium]MDW8165566.1 S-methyl-5-thioribose-1-phosphate isomerase [Elusimicrobiota bacterium]
MKLKKSILLPFYWRNSCLYILDQKKLPFEKKYIRCTSYRDVIRCIIDMNIRGAPAIGIAAGYAFVLAIKEAKGSFNFYKFLKEKAEEIISSRPTAYNIFYCVNRIKEKILSLGNKKNNKEFLFKEALKEVKIIEEENRNALLKIVNYGVALIKNNSSVLTHCNTGPLACGDVGTALGIIIEAYHRGKIKNVYVDETRPYLQGARLTTLELEVAKVPYVLITDNMAAFVIKEKKVSCVIIGADRIARNGDTANKIGSYNLAVLCKYHKIPFYIAAPSSSIDNSIPSGRYIKIEMRPADEVKYINNQPITTKNAKVIHPAFDITDAKLITAIITEKGVFRYPYNFAKI